MMGFTVLSPLSTSKLSLASHSKKDGRFRIADEFARSPCVCCIKTKSKCMEPKRLCLKHSVLPPLPKQEDLNKKRVSNNRRNQSGVFRVFHFSHQTYFSAKCPNRLWAWQWRPRRQRCHGPQLKCQWPMALPRVDLEIKGRAFGAMPSTGAQVRARRRTWSGATPHIFGRAGNPNTEELLGP